MRILFIADGRSPTAHSWIEYFIQSKHEVHLVSTFDCQPIHGLASFQVLPVGYSTTVSKDSSTGRGLRSLLPTGARTWLRNWLAPSTIEAAARQLRSILAKVQPDLVHAMRIPFEGMLAAAADPQAPLVTSVWGNDFTLHAKSNPRMAAATRRAMQRTDALHSDTQRDQRLARIWGFAAGKSALVAPGNGGVRSDVFHPAAQPPETPRVINPRGLRAYVRNDSFFQAIPLVLAELPETQFDCPGTQGEPEAQRWVERLKLGEQVQLLPKLDKAEMAAAYQQAQVMVSPTTHDGTPNSLLEAMACGCFPVCGDLESIREWISDGENGLLMDPGDPETLAAAVVMALRSVELRQAAAERNQQLIAERAEYQSGMQRVEEFYLNLA